MVGCLAVALGLGFLILIIGLAETAPVLFTILLVLGGIVFALWYYTDKQSEKERVAKGKTSSVTQLEYTEGLKRQKYIAEAKWVKYIGGHHEYATERDGGVLRLSKDHVIFCIDGSSVVDGWTVDTKAEYFSIPLKQIDSIACDTKGNLSAIDFFIWGPLAMLMSPDKHYMVINYTTEMGIRNSVVFDCGGNTHQDFINKIHVARNK